MKVIDSIKRRMEEIEVLLGYQDERGVNDYRRQIIKQQIESAERELVELKRINNG